MTKTEFNTQLFTLKGKAEYFASKDKPRHIKARESAKTLENNSITRHSLVKYHENTRDINDRRRKIAKAVFSYYDKNGIEYRKSFTLPAFTHENKFWEIAPEVICL